MSRTLLLSDLHIGFRFSRAEDILYVLNNTKFDRLILVGDIFDIAQMMKRPYWDEHHTAVLKRILKIATITLSTIYRNLLQRSQDYHCTESMSTKVENEEYFVYTATSSTKFIEPHRLSVTIFTTSVCT
mgnify:CR=1 FL=1